MQLDPSDAVRRPRAIALSLDALDVSRLPQQVRMLIGHIGLDQTHALLSACGGRPLYIPNDPDRAGVLSRLLDRASVAALCAAEGGHALDLPKVDKLARQVRDIRIRAASAAGLPHTEIARVYRLTRRQVARIVRAGDRNEP